MSEKPKQKLNVGDLLYSQDKGEVKSYQITKVGIKYYTIKISYFEDRIHKSTLRRDEPNSNNRYQCYKTEKEVTDIILFERAISDIKRVFSSYGNPKITVDQALRIQQILNENNGNTETKSN